MINIHHGIIKSIYKNKDDDYSKRIFIKKSIFGGYRLSWYFRKHIHKNTLGEAIRYSLFILWKQH